MTEMGQPLSAAKFKRLRALSDGRGIIRALAMDQRISLRNTIARAKGAEPWQVTDFMLAEFKTAVSEVLSPFATGVLLDPEYGLDAATKRDKATGLLLAYEQTGYDPKRNGHMPSLLPDWNVEKLLARGADAIKLLVYYNPFADAKVNEVKRAFIARVGAECKSQEAPFFLEPLSYDPHDRNEQGLEYARQKPHIVKAIMEEFSRPEYSVDVLKVEVPVDMRFVAGTRASQGIAAYDREEAKDCFLSAAEASRKPFIYLSAGVSAEEFQESLSLAAEAGVRFSGGLCGRATWQGGVAHYAGRGKQGLVKWLKTKGVQNIRALNDCLAAATGWHSILSPLKLLVVTLMASILWSPYQVARAQSTEDSFRIAAENGVRAEEAFRRARRNLNAWLTHADPRTLLLPDYLPSFKRENVYYDKYTPHNSGADNYPYLVATAFFTDRAIYEGRMRMMLRNEIRYTNVLDGIPGDLELKQLKLGPASIFGAAEYAKDGLLAITELLGRTPWFYRMVDMTAAVMEHAPVHTEFGNLPDNGAEVNGDLLQTLTRLATMTGDRRFLEWAERIGDAYVREVMPRNHGLPGYTWDFKEHRGADRLRLRDHGNEIVVGLMLLYAIEANRRAERAAPYRVAIARMLDRILQSANADGMLYNEIRCSDLEPLDRGLVDNWGYVYGAMYTFYMVTNETKYREAVLRVLKNLPKYRNYDWEHGRQDGYADTIESALYLVAREPVPEALDFIETEIRTLMAFQKSNGDGTVESAYPDGNWARTVLLYALMKTQGCYVDDWREGVRLGARRVGNRLYLSLEAPRPWRGKLHFDFARHRRVLNFDRDYVRLNEWPEWFTVDENTIYKMQDATGRARVLLGSELKEGVPIKAPGRWLVQPLSNE
jgi:tagatose 1,6-diphosphate aldolase